MKSLIAIVTILLFYPDLALTETQLPESEEFYYGQDIAQNKGQTPDFKKQLHEVLNSHHISKDKTYDKIVSQCNSNENDHCYAHNNLGYYSARRHLFGKIHLENSSGYFVVSSYCSEVVDNSDLPNDGKLGPMEIPSSNVINTEHVWPQSHFSGAFSKSIQKADLHSLLPVLMPVNSTRGNYPFGRVRTVVSEACANAALGKDSSDHYVFEPTDEIKGNVARALFYFSTRYNIAIGRDEERVLRDWHQQDPVDLEESVRHEMVFEVQHVRNPFVDHPEWVEAISNF